MDAISLFLISYGIVQGIIWMIGGIFFIIDVVKEVKERNALDKQEA